VAGRTSPQSAGRVGQLMEGYKTQRTTFGREGESSTSPVADLRSGFVHEARLGPTQREPVELLEMAALEKARPTMVLRSGEAPVSSRWKRARFGMSRARRLLVVPHGNELPSSVVLSRAVWPLIGGEGCLIDNSFMR
jgi:hypothetical protein